MKECIINAAVYLGKKIYTYHIYTKQELLAYLDTV